jgi:hypothetical protein
MTNDELREEIARLRTRVARLEGCLEGLRDGFRLEGEMPLVAENIDNVLKEEGHEDGME